MVQREHAELEVLFEYHPAEHGLQDADPFCEYNPGPQAAWIICSNVQPDTPHLKPSQQCSGWDAFALE